MFTAIGFVQSPVKEQIDSGWGSVVSTIRIEEEFSKGLQGLQEFTHIVVLCYLDQASFDLEKHLVRHPQGRADMPKLGIFAQRAKDRPNPIGLSTVQLISVAENIITVQGLDAIDETPVLDIKPYFPRYDLKTEAIVPEWVDRLLKDYF